MNRIISLSDQELFNWLNSSNPAETAKGMTDEELIFLLFGPNFEGPVVSAAWQEAKSRGLLKEDR